MNGNSLHPVSTGSPPSYESTVHPSGPVPPFEDAPPNYQAAIEQTPTVSSAEGTSFLGQPSSSEQPGRTILTIDGKYIVSSTAPQEPIYSLTHALDGHETNATGVLLTRIERRPVRSQQGGTTSTKKRDVYALRHRSPPHLLSYGIDGKMYLSGKSGLMWTRAGKRGMGWTAEGKDLPSFTLRPVASLSGGQGKQYEWRDNKTKNVVAIETRRTWDTKQRKELTPPQLDLKIDLEDVDKEYMDFFMAAWCMHNWREAKDMTREPLTWGECELLSLLLLIISSKLWNFLHTLMADKTPRPSQGPSEDHCKEEKRKLVLRRWSLLSIRRPWRLDANVSAHSLLRNLDVTFQHTGANSPGAGKCTFSIH